MLTWCAHKVANSQRLGFFCMGAMTPPMLVAQIIRHPIKARHCPRDIYMSIRGSFAHGATHGISYCLGMCTGTVSLAVITKLGTFAFHARGF